MTVTVVPPGFHSIHPRRAQAFAPGRCGAGKTGAAGASPDRAVAGVLLSAAAVGDATQTHGSMCDVEFDPFAATLAPARIVRADLPAAA